MNTGRPDSENRDSEIMEAQENEEISSSVEAHSDGSENSEDGFFNKNEDYDPVTENQIAGELNSSRKGASLSYGYFWETALLVLAVAVFRWLVAGKVGLGDSEAYYYAWSRHLDLSYFDHPPLIAWLIRLSSLYFGDSISAVRMPSVVLSAGITFLVYFAGVRILKNGKAGFYGALLFSFCHVYFIGGLAAAPDVALIFFWMLAILFIYDAVERESGVLLVLASLALGLALLSKYNAVLFIPPAFIYLSLKESGRRLLFSRWMLISIGVFLLLVFPVLFWNYQHDWASFRFHLVERHSAAGFSLKNLLVFMGGQLLYFSLFIWLLIFVSFGWLQLNLFSGRIPSALFMFLFSTPLLIFFFAVGAWTPESEPHWSAIGYLPLFPLAGLFLARHDAKSFSHKALQVALIFAAVANIGLWVHILSNTFVEALPDDSYRPKLDISNELYGWDEAGNEMQRLVSENRNLAFAASYHYTMCGQLEFALKGALPVYCANHRRDAFDFFTDSSMPPVGRDGLIVTDNRYDREPRELYQCKDMQDLSRIDIKRGSKTVRTFRFTICNGFRNIQAEDYKYIPLPPAPVPELEPPVKISVPVPAEEPVIGPTVAAPEIVPLPEKGETEGASVMDGKSPESTSDAPPVPVPVEEVPEPEMLEI